MKTVYLFLSFVLTLTCSNAVQNSEEHERIQDLIIEWEKGFISAFEVPDDVVVIRESNDILVYENFVSGLSCTKAFRDAVKTTGVEHRDLYNVASTFDWDSEFVKVYFSFLLCDIVGIDSQYLLYYSGVQHKSLLRLLGILCFGETPVKKELLTTVEFPQETSTKSKMKEGSPESGTAPEE